MVIALMGSWRDITERQSGLLWIKSTNSRTTR
jgi:hypothetical protein